MSLPKEVRLGPGDIYEAKLGVDVILRVTAQDDVELRKALERLRTEYFMAGGEMTFHEACELIDAALGWHFGGPR